MLCLNGTQSNAACQHRTTLVCADTSQIFNVLASGNFTGLSQQPGGCYQLAMQWLVPTGAFSPESVWTNVMPHEVWKGLALNITSGVDVELLNQDAVATATPSYQGDVLISDNPILARIQPCNDSHAYLARTQAMANLQAFQVPNTSLQGTMGPGAGSPWQLLQVPTASELQTALSLRACQYINATKSPLQAACPLSAADLQGFVAASPRPTGNFCYFQSPSAQSITIQEAVIRTGQTIAGVLAETDLASSVIALQSVALIQCPATSFTTLFLTVSSTGISVVTCEKDHVRRGIERLTKVAVKMASRWVPARSVKTQHIMPALVAYTIYMGVSLGIATPAVAIVVTNLMYSRASFTATLLSYSTDVSTVPQLELTLTETVKLLYKPRNYLVSVLVGVVLCALSLLWGVTQAMKACKAAPSAEAVAVKDTSSSLAPAESDSSVDSAKLLTWWSLPEGALQRQAWKDKSTDGIR